jgi:hypothetical protein
MLLLQYACQMIASVLVGSSCFSAIRYKYWQASPKRAKAFFVANAEVQSAVFALLRLLEVEQRHFSLSPYFYKPLPHPGKFAEDIGLVWSFARPSDDQTQ